MNAKANLRWDLWRAGRDDPPGIAARQRARLGAMVRFARAHSAFYRERYRHLPDDIEDLRRLPPVGKAELMAHFDTWLTDSGLERAGIDTFLADPDLIGHLYCGRYAVWTTSGTTGEPGIFVHDRRALAVYNGCLAVRGWARWLGLRSLPRLLRRGAREAVIVATGGHFAGVSAFEAWRRSVPRFAARLRAFSVLSPLAELVRELSAFQPAVLFGYPSALKLLALEQSGGGLDLAPVLVLTAGETLSAETCRVVEAAFGCPLRNVYGASEFNFLALECPHGNLHLNADWAVLEPVDRDYRPVPVGTASHTVLLSNLANRVQPLLRYDLGDSVTLLPEACPCGSPLPLLRVEGRASDTLQLATPAGDIVQLLPLALGTVMEETPGVRRCQLVQTGPAQLAIRFEPTRGSSAAGVWKELEGRLRRYLEAQGATGVRLLHDRLPPQVHSRGGKFRQVYAEPGVDAASASPARRSR